MSIRRPLTERETEVLRLIRSGIKYPVIANVLGVKPRTIAATARNIRKKLQIDRQVYLRNTK